MRSRGERARADSPGVNCLLRLVFLNGKEFRDWQCAAFLRVDGRIVGMRFRTEDSDVGVLPRSSLEASSKFFFLFFRDQSALCLGSMGSPRRSWSDGFISGVLGPRCVNRSVIIF